ncbi:MAG: NPCBM/NEW2 domain-containing protein, partial [Pirellulales bacterium]
MQFPVLAFLALLAATPVQIRTLDGQQRPGEISALQAGRLTLEVDGAPVELNAADLLEVRPDNVPEPDEFLLERSIAVRFVDHSLLHVKSFSLGNREATALSESIGEFTVPHSEILSVRLAELQSPVRSAWNALQERETKSDLLVVRKMDSLDFVGGVIASVGDDGVHALLNNREATIPTNRSFGLIFAQAAPQRREPACEVFLSSGDRLVLKDVAIQDDQLRGTLLAGPAVNLPLAQVKVVDFGLGRVRYLADLTESASYQPVGLITSEDVLKLRKNMNSIGGDFIVGKQSYDRGLWIHSGTTLKYRLNRDYRRLQATMGVDRSASGCARVNPQMLATIIGDGRSLFEGRFGWDGEPQSLDLDVAGVRDLEIRIEPANPETIGACEHLVLAEARV